MFPNPQRQNPLKNEMKTITLRLLYHKINQLQDPLYHGPLPSGEKNTNFLAMPAIPISSSARWQTAAGRAPAPSGR
jgi:hypothetical protein